MYFDHSATSPMLSAVREAMGAFRCDGNPSSVHRAGQQAREVVETSRELVAALVGAMPSEVVLESSATEANNHVLQATVMPKLLAGESVHIVVSAIEHPCVMMTARYLEQHGARVSVAPVSEDGVLDLNALQEMVGEDTALVSVMLVNNETGAVQPVAKVAEIAHRVGALCHTDAVQAVGRIPVDMVDLGCDFLTLSAHKLGGQLGVGCLIARHVPQPLLHGGFQEAGARAGTPAVPAIYALGVACETVREFLVDRSDHFSSLAHHFLSALSDCNVQRNGVGVDHIVNLSFAGFDAQTLMMQLDMAGVCVSTGAACSTGSIDPSPVLCAMYGEQDPRIGAALRWSFGWETTVAQIDAMLKILLPVVGEVR